MPRKRPSTRPACLAVEALEAREMLTATPYVIPVAAGVTTQSILTVGDDINGYRMVGHPDGLGAFDNGDGTFTVLMDQELAKTAGSVRAHGATGAFVSKWIINKSDLSVVSGSDLMQHAYLWDTTMQQPEATPTAFAFATFCSADLPDVSAYYYDPTPADPLSGDEVGTTNRIFMDGEETSDNGYAMAHIVTGPLAGNSYVLGKFGLNTNGTGSAFHPGYENLLANAFPQAKTVVIGNNDGGNGIMGRALSVYVGTKTNTGTDVDMAGLNNGVLKFVNVTGHVDADGATLDELTDTTTRNDAIANGTRFTLSATSSTNFSRPEDGAWNPLNPKEYYFVTTDRYDQVSDGVGAQIGQTRLWRLTFDDITNPDAGGKIDCLINARTVNGQKVNMFDNITVDAQNGHIILLEDVGANAHNGKLWDYNPANDTLVQVAKHDPARFGDLTIPATAPFNQVEETSGVLDVSSILGPGSYLFDDQAHYPIDAAHPNGFANPDELSEGGQLLLMKIGNLPPSPAADSYKATEDHTLSVAADKGVLANDTDIDGDALTSGIKTQAHHGTVALNADGSFTYTPTANFNGTDSFTYTTFTYNADDSPGSTSTGTVTLTVAAVNDAPVAKADKATTKEDTAVTVKVLANDTDIDHDKLTTIVLAKPLHGTVTHLADGSFKYTPAKNYNGSDSFTYTLRDGHSGTATAKVTLTVSAVNDAPVNKVPTPRKLKHGATLKIAGVSISDVDAGSQPMRVTLTVIGGGTIRVSSAAGTSKLVLNGSQATLNKLLARLTFTAGPKAGTAKIRIVTTDLGHSPSSAKTDTDYVTIAVS